MNYILTRLVKKIFDCLKKKSDDAGRDIRISTSESCTGGLLGAYLTAVPGSSRHYIGGAIVYDNFLKTRFSGVREETLKNHGAVSGETVVEMAKGISDNAAADISIAISGVAGPSGGTTEKPVGTVFFGFHSRNGSFFEKRYFRGGRDEVRLKSVKFALKKLLDIITEF
ncbi:MAG TPA: CinA family protein [Candidatus Wallbacteria bacterium]|nr:CinA family protein [Candidatus Wallbacteria bacterium]